MLPDPARLIGAARGEIPADAVFYGGEVFNPFTCRFESGTVAVHEGIVVGIGEYDGLTGYDCTGSFLIPGLIDAHVHIESSLLTPYEYARLVAQHGTATVVADPHEIANVAGIAGLEFMLAERDGLPVDIRYMLPSCVPATPADAGGAVLPAASLARFAGRPGVLGLGEMMNFPGVLAADRDVLDKIALLPLRDGHAPLLRGRDLNAYVLAGLQSDHESTRFSEAEEKLARGMYLYIREGSTERNIEELAPLVTATTVSRCCFATDDCHADLLLEDGHIDRCIRRAVSCGIQPELAIRMATLSASERFGLVDRGALSPGRRADFSVVDDPERFSVRQVFVAGKDLAGWKWRTAGRLPVAFRCGVPSPEAIRIRGQGMARVIGIVPHQIVTESLLVPYDGAAPPDNILTLVVCNRYGTGAVGTGLVRGFGFRCGAIASSVAHDAHNLIASGTSDQEIRSAIGEVIRMGGGMAAVIGDESTSLPLDCSGLMSTLPYEDVVSRMRDLHAMTDRMGGTDDPFMYLSFLSLTVIPALRLTDRGPFDATRFMDVPLFSEDTVQGNATRKG